MLVIFSHAVRITQTPGSRSFTNTWRPAYCLPKEICPLLPTSFSAAGWAGLRQPWRGSVIVLQQSLWFVWHQLSSGKAELAPGLRGVSFWASSVNPRQCSPPVLEWGRRQHDAGFRQRRDVIQRRANPPAGSEGRAGSGPAADGCRRGVWRDRCGLQPGEAAARLRGLPG